MRRHTRLATVGALVMTGWLAATGAEAGAAAGAAVVPSPTITPDAGMVEVGFPLESGRATVLIPDDIAAGEPFSGTFQAPKGYVLTQGTQRARAGRTFAWRVPADMSDGMVLVLQDRRGQEQGRVTLQTPAARRADVEFRFPSLVQEGRTFPVHGPFDGNLHTTRLNLGGASMQPLVESVRKAVVRAPAHRAGLTSGTVRDAGRSNASRLRSVSLVLGPSGTTEGGPRRVTVSGLAGFTHDVPVEVGGDRFYVRAEEIAEDGTVSVQRRIRGGSLATASLLIPQSRREEVELVLRTPQRDRSLPLHLQHAATLRTLDFDTLPVSTSLLADPYLGGDVVFAMLALDEARALPLIFESMPESGNSIQLITFDYFISRPAAVRAAAATVAREAALRVLRRILSSTNAELALYVIGLTGSEADFPLLEQFNGRKGIATLGLRDASEAALARLGSRTHLERVRTELMTPLATGASYADGVRVARALRKAGFAARRELLPQVCGHLDDRRVGDIDVHIDPGLVAQSQLAAILGDAPMPQLAERRTPDQWRAYCRAAAAP